MLIITLPINVIKYNAKLGTFRRWVAAHMCVLSHFRTCDVRAEVRAERVCNCAFGSACVWAYLDLRFAIALFHLFSKPHDCCGQLGKNIPEEAFYIFMKGKGQIEYFFRNNSKTLFVARKLTNVHDHKEL